MHTDSIERADWNHFSEVKFKSMWAAVKKEKEKKESVSQGSRWREVNSKEACSETEDTGKVCFFPITLTLKTKSVRVNKAESARRREDITL